MTTERALKYFDALLSGLALMEDDGCIHQAYSIVLAGADSGHKTQLLAEAMHQRWLSDALFPPIAARLAFQMRDMTSPKSDIRFSSLVFVILMNDFKDRFTMQKSNAVVFCNSAVFAFHFYGHFKDQGPIYQSLVGPLFDYLQMLLHDNAEAVEISTVSQMFHKFGRSMQSMSFSKSLAVCLRVRKKLVETGDRMTPRDRALLMEIVELSQHRWDFELLQPGVAVLYEGYRLNDDDVQATRGGRARRKHGYTMSRTGDETQSPPEYNTPSSSRKVSIADSSIFYGPGSVSPEPDEQKLEDDGDIETIV